jgi:hypothetical protein
MCPGYLQVAKCDVSWLQQLQPSPIPAIGKGLRKYRLRIYTTWGQKIFETTSLSPDGSPNVAWDGT